MILAIMRLMSRLLKDFYISIRYYSIYNISYIYFFMEYNLLCDTICIGIRKKAYL